MEKISDLLTNARKKLGLTLLDVSRKTKIGLTTINAWERGASYPRAKNRRAIADFYSIPEEKLTAPTGEGDRVEAAQREFLSQFQSRVVMLRKTAWADAESLVKKYDAHDLNDLFDKLVSEAKAQPKR